MYLDVDLDLGNVIVSTPGLRTALSSVSFKFDTDGEIRVRFWSGGVQTELAGTTITGAFALKEKSKYDGDPLVSADSWTKVGTGADTYYTFAPDFFTEALETALASGDGNEDNDEDFVIAMLEIEWVIDGAKYRTTNTPQALVYNSVIKDADGTPSSAATPDDEWVAHGHAQTLTLAQKTQALENIGADRKFVAKTVSVDTPTSSINILAGLRYQFVEVTSSAEVDPGATSQKLGLPVTDVLPGDVIEIRLKTLSTTPANLPLNLYTRNPGPGTWTTLLASLRNVGDSIRLTCLTASASVSTWMIEPFLPRYASLSAANAAEAAIGVIFWDTTLLRQRVTTATS